MFVQGTYLVARSRDGSGIRKLVRTVGDKLQDNSIDTAQIIANVLIPEEVTGLPDKQILSVEWPFELLRQAEERVVLSRGGEELPISMFNLDLVATDPAANAIDFRVVSADETVWADFRLTIGGDEGFRVARSSGSGDEFALAPSKIRWNSGCRTIHPSFALWICPNLTAICLFVLNMPRTACFPLRDLKPGTGPVSMWRKNRSGRTGRSAAIQFNGARQGIS